MTIGTKEYFYPETTVGGFSSVDGTIQFYTRVNALLKSDMIVVDLGAGRGQAHSDDPVEYRRNLRLLRGKCRRVIGLDVDPAVFENPSLDEAKLIEKDGVFPLDDASVDLIVSDATFEHVDEPGKFVSEISRVLRPGGWICARTPNKFGYIAIGAQIVPNRLHVWMLRHLQPKRKAIDVFPTRYRLNTRAALRRCFPNSCWKSVHYIWNAGPAYFGTSKLLWALCLLMYRLSPTSIGATILFFGQRQTNAQIR